MDYHIHNYYNRETDRDFHVDFSRPYKATPDAMLGRWVCALLQLALACALETPWTREAADALAAADALQQKQDWKKSVEKYHLALSISPTPSAVQQYVIYNNLGWSLYHLGEWTIAEDHYKRALRAAPQRPPTDHAYINLATLYKAEHRLKPTIKAYRSAISLTHQLPTWAQLGNSLIMDFRVDEAVHVLQEGLAYRGESSAAAQECHGYLGRAHLSRRNWPQASQHFVKSLELGLPSDASGCRNGRWSVAEGWQNDSHVTVCCAFCVVRVECMGWCGVLCESCIHTWDLPILSSRRPTSTPLAPPHLSLSHPAPPTPSRSSPPHPTYPADAGAPHRAC